MLQNFPMYSYIPAKDLGRARSFYEKKVGLKNGEEIAGGIAYRFADHTACFMYETPLAGTSQESQAWWKVDDLEREMSELKSRGVKFEDYDLPGVKTVNGVSDHGDGSKAAWFKDSEGNIMALIQPPS